jgi:hypothetical protein
MKTPNWKQRYRAALAAGILTRLFQYLDNRNLWLDEAMLALNLLDKSYLQLLQPLDYKQAAPVLFLWLEKTAAFLFGPSEYSLRFWPLLLSILTLPLLYRLALRLTRSPLAATLALWMAAFSPFLVRYASEVKQYTVDAFAATLLLWMAVRRAPNGRPDWSLLLAGVVTVFLSHIAPVALAVVLAYLALVYVQRRRERRPAALVAVLAPALAWALALAAFYYFQVRHHPTQASMAAYWKYAFAPAGPWSPEFWKWLRLGTIDLLSNLFFYSSSGEGCLERMLLQGLVLGGLIAAVWLRQYRLLFFILAPLAAHLTLSVWQLYPYAPRTALYLMPLYLILIGGGLAAGLGWLERRTGRRVGRIATGVLFAALVVPWAWNHPIRVEETRPSLDFLRERSRPADPVFVSYDAWPAFHYYDRLSAHPLPNPVVASRAHPDHRDQLLEELQALPSDVWVVVRKPGGGNGLFIREYLRERGQVLDSFAIPGSGAWRFRLDSIRN